MRVPGGARVPDSVGDLVDRAIAVYRSYAEPAGLLAEISLDVFAALYEGEGGNAPDTPLEHVFKKADTLAVFALTLGNRISEKINRLAVSKDIALAGTLDATASVAADAGAAYCEQLFFEGLPRKVKIAGEVHVLSYSPGYCGWHVSGQKQLFRFLKPEQVGIELNEQYLMTPIKSVSGVLVAGAGEVHYFEPRWSFCETCTTHACLTRMKRVKHAAEYGGDDGRR